MPSSDKDFDDDWEEVDAPFPLSKEHLARLNLVCHDDDLREACILLHRRKLQLLLTSNQTDMGMSRALMLVLGSLEQTTHTLEMMHEERRGSGEELREMREEIDRRVTEIKRRSEELERAGEDVMAILDEAQMYKTELQDRVDAEMGVLRAERQTMIGQSDLKEKLLAQARLATAKVENKLALAESTLEESQRQEKALNGKLDENAAEMGAMRQVQRELTDQLKARDAEFAKVEQQCAKVGTELKQKTEQVKRVHKELNLRLVEIKRKDVELKTSKEKSAKFGAEQKLVEGMEKENRRLRNAFGGS